MLMPPTNKPYLDLNFYNNNTGDWETERVTWKPPALFADQVEEARRKAVKRWGEDPWDREIELPAAYARVGRPTMFVHAARVQALREWRDMNDRLAMRDYLGEWLREFGDIFAEDRAWLQSIR